jgi:dTMP kinase
MSGVLFSFEGIDGVGKTTQVGLLKASLEQLGHSVVCLREPGGTLLGERIRGLLLDRSEDPPSAIAELLLFAAARAQIVATKVRPALERGEVVILDRFTDATFAYQGFGRGLPLEQILSVEAIAAGIAPHRTWYLDLTPEESARRRAARGEAPDRMELEGETFRERVRAGYLERARLHPERIAVVDAAGTIEAIAERILAEAVERLG